MGEKLFRLMWSTLLIRICYWYWHSLCIKPKECKSKMIWKLPSVIYIPLNNKAPLQASDYEIILMTQVIHIQKFHCEQVHHISNPSSNNDKNDIMKTMTMSWLCNYNYFESDYSILSPLFISRHLSWSNVSISSTLSFVMSSQIRYPSYLVHLRSGL